MTPEQPINEELADVVNPSEKEESGFKIANTPESESIINKSNELAERIQRNEPIKVGHVLELEKALSRIKIDIGGDMMTVEEIKKNPNIQEQIKKPNFKEQLDLNKKVATGIPIYIEDLEFLTKAAAESLSQHEGELFLTGLTFLSDAAAKSLSMHQGGLYLNGLTLLSDEAIKYLSRYQGRLDLSGLSFLSDDAAESLSRHKKDLWLNDLASLSDKAAESLSKHQGHLYVPYHLQQKINQFKSKK